MGKARITTGVLLVTLVTGAMGYTIASAVLTYQDLGFGAEIDFAYIAQCPSSYKMGHQSDPSISLPLRSLWTSTVECDRNLEAMLDVLAAEQEHDPGQLPKARTKTKQVGTPSFDVRAALFGVLGLDLTQIHGLGPSLTLKLVGECGTDLRPWPSAKHFTSWLCLAPGNKISGGNILWSRTRRSSSCAAALLRLAAVTIGRSDTASGAFYRRLAARAGKVKAVTATARKIAVLVYNTLRYGMTYKDPSASHYESDIATASSVISSAAPSHWAIIYKSCLRRPTWLFLRKPTAYCAREAQ
jgi:hypothetical protein